MLVCDVGFGFVFGFVFGCIIVLLPLLLIAVVVEQHCLAKTGKGGSYG